MTWVTRSRTFHFGHGVGSAHCLPATAAISWPVASRAAESWSTGSVVIAVSWLSHEREGLLRQWQPTLLGSLAEHHPLPHRHALARVERRPVSAGHKLSYPLTRKFQHQPAAPGHGEDPSVDLKGAGAEAASSRTDCHAFDAGQGLDHRGEALLEHGSLRHGHSLGGSKESLH